VLGEPAVLDRRVAGDDVHEHPQPALVGGADERVHVVQRSEARVDVRVVGDVVAAVGERRRVDGRQPQRIGAEAGDVLQPPGDAGEVALAVAVGVLKRARVDLVDDGVAPPRLGGSVGHSHILTVRG
jgi:hypothetical protein